VETVNRQRRHEKKSARLDWVVLSSDPQRGPSPHCVVNLVLVVGTLAVGRACLKHVQPHAEEVAGQDLARIPAPYSSLGDGIGELGRLERNVFDLYWSLSPTAAGTPVQPVASGETLAGWSRPRTRVRPSIWPDSRAQEAQIGVSSEVRGVPGAPAFVLT
jgi:hypothetical protein